MKDLPAPHRSQARGGPLQGGRVAAPVHRWDAAVAARVARWPVTPADRWLRRLSTVADRGALWVVVAGGLGLPPGRTPLRRAAVRGLASLGTTSLLVNLVLKRVFRRGRPDPAGIPAARALAHAPGSASFPSGHAASAAAFATGVAVESPLAGALVAPLALGVAWSRVHVGVHHPSDVVAGLAVGTAVALAGRRWAGPPGR